MPYIKPERRKNFKASRVVSAVADNPGELNYLITTLVFNYFEDHGEDYQAINDVIGALEGAKLEFYRRVAVPYEDRKIQENGDVYG